MFIKFFKDRSNKKFINKALESRSSSVSDSKIQTVGIILLWLSAFLTLYTGYDYLAKGIDHALSKDREK